MDDFIVKLIARLDASKTKTDLKSIESDLNARGINLKASLDTATTKQELKNLASQLQQILKSQGLDIGTDKILAGINQVKREAASMNKVLSETDKVSALTKFQNYMAKNTNITKAAKNQILEWIRTIESADELTRDDLNNINAQFKQLDTNMRMSGRLGLSFGDSIKKGIASFSAWLPATTIVMGTINTIKTGIRDVREFDDSLLELSKVSDLSAEGLARVTDEAYKLGDRVGRTGRQVVDAVTEFKRAGFELNDSMDMAESALVMTNVAEGIDDTADAAGTLISVLKGFNMDASETMTIVDKINQVSNTSPIGFDNIAEGLERTAGTMAQSGNTIDQTIGLITAGYAQLRNVEKVSTGLVTLSARLRGVGEDGEVIDGLSAKLQEDFGKIGVAIENADGSLRSIYEIAQDYSKVLPTLTDKQKQYYAELAAGKRQVTVWNAITQQFQDAENAVSQSLNSQNSALDENQKKLDSIGGHVKSFESAMEHLSSTVVDSDLVKFFVDLGTTGVKAIDGIVNALTPLGTAAGIGGIVAGIKNVGVA